jgi:hypothetical protein
MFRRLLGCVAIVAVVGCAGPTAPPSDALSSPPASSVVAASPQPSATAVPTLDANLLRYVAFGDSWPEGGHCGGCRTFAGLWAVGLERLTGRIVEFTDMTGSHERSTANGKTSLSLLQAVRNDARTRETIAAADVILISTGGNEMLPVVDQIKAGTCGDDDESDCIAALGERWRTNYDAILTEIDTLRAGQPTVIRFVNDENPFVSYPELAEGLPDGFATGGGARIFKLLHDTMCEAALAHGGLCVDVRPIINGPSLDQPGNENSPAVMQAIADALLATGVAELDLP